MCVLTLHQISFRIVAVAYAKPLNNPLTLRRISPAYESKQCQSGEAPCSLPLDSPEVAK